MNQEKYCYFRVKYSYFWVHILTSEYIWQKKKSVTAFQAIVKKEIFFPVFFFFLTEDNTILTAENKRVVIFLSTVLRSGGWDEMQLITHK